MPSLRRTTGDFDIAIYFRAMKASARKRAIFRHSCGADARALPARFAADEDGLARRPASAR